MNAIRKYTLSIVCLTLMAVPVIAQDELSIPAEQASAGEKFQVVLLQSNSVISGSFVFGESQESMAGMTTGAFGAELEGQVLLGQVTNLDFGSASLWMAQAGNEQSSLMASGLKSQGFLFGQASLLVDGIPVNTFVILGQEAPMNEMTPEPVAAVPARPTASPSPPSAQPDTGPFAPDARPSVFNR